MSGEVVNISGGRLPSASETTESLDAGRTALAAHDPFQPVLESQKRMVTFLETIAARVEQGPEERALPKVQLRSVEQSARGGAQDGVRRQATIIGWWMAAIVGGAAVLGVVAGAVGASYVAAGRDIDTQSTLGAMPATDAAAWAKLVRDNPPIGRLLAQAQPIPGETRGKAVAMAVWVDPPKPATPGAH